jgi:hypothetical protein
VNGLALPPRLKAEMHDRQIGHFTSIRSRHFLIPVCEDVWPFSPTGRSPITPDAPGVGVPYVWADQPARFGHFRERHCRGNALHLPYKTTQSRADRDYHPAPFPVALAEHCLRTRWCSILSLYYSMQSDCVCCTHLRLRLDARMRLSDAMKIIDAIEEVAQDNV